MPIIGSSRAVPQKSFYDPAAEALALLSGCSPENIDEDPYDSDSLDDVPTELDDMNQDSTISAKGRTEEPTSVVSAKEGIEESTSSDAVTEPVDSKPSRNLSSNETPKSVIRSVVSDSTINQISTRSRSNDDMNLPLRKSSRISKSSSGSSLSPAIKNNTSTRSDGILSTRLRSRSSRGSTVESAISKLRVRKSEASSKGGIRQFESDKSNFEARFQDLVKYKKENGHCLVPKKYPPNPSLSYFVFRMRYFYNKKQKSHLTQERINRLNKIGFSWWTKSTDAQKKFEAKRREPKRDSKWESFFDEFVQFQKKFGSSLIPKVYPENQTLSSWAHKQRLDKQKLEKGEKTDMTMDQKKKLDEIGFIWNAKASEEWKAIELRRKQEDFEELWQKRFSELVEFKAKEGHTRVPKNYPQNSSLSSWVFRQRGIYKKMMNGEEVNGVTPKRFKQLQDIGFEFGIRSKINPSQELLNTYLASSSKVKEETAEAIVNLWRSKYEPSDDKSKESDKSNRDKNNADDQKKCVGKKRHGENAVTDRPYDSAQGRNKRRRK